MVVDYLREVLDVWVVGGAMIAWGMFVAVMLFGWRRRR